MTYQFIVLPDVPIPGITEFWSTRAGRLRAHLARAAATPFARPHADCCFLVADWVRDETGTDPAADLRGRYHDERGARRLIRSWGGFLTMWKVHMAFAGFNETRHPAPGDIGVVVDAAGQTVAAIRTGRGWAAKTTAGVVVSPFRTLAAWSLDRG